MRIKQTILLITAAVFAISFSHCSRSKQHKHDEKYYSDYPDSYYDPVKAKSATERLEVLGQPKKKLYVMDFHNITPVQTPGLGEFAGNEIRRGLFLSQRVIVPTDLRSQFSTRHFLENERVRVAQLVREGRRMGVSVILIGRIAKIVFRQKGDEVGLLRQMQSLAAVDLEIKVFDVVSGREVMAIGRSGEAASSALAALESQNLSDEQFRAELTKLAIRDAVARLTPTVVTAIEKMSWEGRIAKVLGNKYYLNSGRRAGLVHGDILRVLTSGNDVYDPETGAFLGRTQGQLKGTVEVVDFLGPDAAVGVLHTGGNFQEGDVVRLY